MLDLQYQGARTYSNDNRTVHMPNHLYPVRSKNFKIKGKWYAEVVCTNVINSYVVIGLGNDSYKMTSYDETINRRIYYAGTGQAWTNVGKTYGARYYKGDTIGVAVDMDNGTLSFYLNGVFQGIAFNDIKSFGEKIYLVATPNMPTTEATLTFNFKREEMLYPIPNGYEPWEYTRKHLIKSNNNLFYLNNTSNSWEELSLSGSPTVSDFKSYGVNEIAEIPQNLNSYSIITWTDTTLPQQFKLKGTKIEPFQLTKLENSIPIAWTSNLKKVDIKSSVDNGIKYSISFDNSTWYGSNLNVVELNRENVRDNGMTLNELTSLTSSHYESVRNKSSELYLAIYFPNDESVINEITILGDEWGSYSEVEPLHVNYKVKYINPKTMQISLYKNHDAVKINY